MKRLFLLLLLALPMQALADQAPSFDCAKASTDVEHAICDSEELSKMDREMATLYREFRAGLSEEDRAFAVQLQRQWLRQIAVCGGRADCLVGKYREWLFNAEHNVIAAKFELNDETRDLVSSFTGTSMVRNETEFDFQSHNYYGRENICYEETISVEKSVVSISDIVEYNPGCSSDGDLQYDSLRLVLTVEGDKWIVYRSYIYVAGNIGYVNDVFDVFVNASTGYSSFVHHLDWSGRYYFEKERMMFDYGAGRGLSAIYIPSYGGGRSRNKEVLVESKNELEKILWIDESESTYLGVEFELLEESVTDKVNSCAERGFTDFVLCMSSMNSNVEQARYYFDNHLNPSDLDSIASAKPLLKEFLYYIDEMKSVPDWKRKMQEAAIVMPRRYICGSHFCYDNKNNSDRDPFIEQGFYTNPIYANLYSPAAYMSFEEWIYMFLARRISDGSLDDIEYMLRQSIEMMEEAEAIQQISE